MFNLKFEKKIFLAVVTVILLTGVSSFGLAYAPSADVFAGLVGCPAENKSVFATQNLVYIFGSNLPDGNYYVRVTTTGGVTLGTSTGTVTVSGGTLVCTQLVSIVFKESNGSIPGWDQTTQNINYKIKISTDNTFPNGGSLEFDGFKVASATSQDTSITLVKIVNNNYGGSNDENSFGLTVDGVPVDSGQIVLATPNVSVTINENTGTGYSLVGVTGTGCPQTLPGTVTPASGQQIICEITNQDIQPKLIVIKHVVKDNGGNDAASDFTMSVTGTDVTSSSFAGEESPGTEVGLDAGSYSVGESGPSGYSADYSADCSGTISIGETKTCTVTNDDIAPCITLTKNVINVFDNKLPADFKPTVNGVIVTSDVQTCDLQSNTPIPIDETQLFGFVFQETTTDDAKCPNVLGGTVTLNEGENISCTITNKDIRGKLNVYKFYDKNTNGVYDEAEPFTDTNLNGEYNIGEPFTDTNLNGVYDSYLISGWKVLVDNVIHFTFYNDLFLPGNHVVSEFTPIQTNWKNTTPKIFDPVVVVSGEYTNVKFGNVCTGPGGGLSKGFWGNKNGFAKMNDGGTVGPELALLSSYHLKNGAGDDFDPTTYAQFTAWLQAANAVNMSYMLSAQLSAMILNVESGSVSGSSLIYAPELVPYAIPGLTPAGFISINDLMAAADATLVVDGYTPAGDPLRAKQEALKNVLDRGDNNIGFVQANPCPFSFAP